MTRMLTVVLLAMLPALGSPALAAETRCGWLSNPTPANWFLDDGDGSWAIQTQGSEGAEGQDLIPDISMGDYVRTNGNYGYACACMTVVAADDGGDKRITRIASFRQLPLATCRKDPALPAPE